MIVVGDTTPLRYLVVLGNIDVIPQLFGQLHCPEEVIGECRHARAPEVLREWVEAPPTWLIIHKLQDVEPELASGLDSGEAAAITLAQLLEAEVILIDERGGRLVALERGFIPAGTLNILAQAGIRGWLDYHAASARLKNETNFHATQAVIDAAWQAIQPR